jgi:hydrogenase-4 component B
MSPGALLLLAALGLVAGIILGPSRPRVWLAATLLAAVAAGGAALLGLAGGPAWEWHSRFRVGGEPLHFLLDGISALFLLLLAIVAGTGAAYAHEYWSDHDYPQSAPRGRRWWSVLGLSLGVTLLAANGLHFLLGWELYAVCAYYLITLDGQRRDVRAAGWLYLAASHAATLCLFAFFTLLAVHTGGWELGPLRERPELAPLFWLALFGFGLKAGLFPLHIWLPSAHASAPSHVSAMLSGFALKIGIYGLIRFSGWMPVPAEAGWVLIGLGAGSALLGMAFALAQNDLKRLLAYCSVENIGIILIGFGLALLGAAHGDAPWGRLALAGALLHVWNHGLYKSLLFLGAGSILHATGTREMSRLGGLWRAMPWTAGLFTFGAVAIAGLPPLNGFVSEWLIYLGLFDAVTARGPSAWIALPAVILLGLSGALALATFTKAGAVVFLGAPRTRAAAHAHESGPWMRGPMLLLSVLCVGLALAPALLWPVLARVATTWHAGWVVAEPPAPLALLGSVQLALAVVAGLAGYALWRLARANGLRRGLTWDCGYAAPTPRMQYTSGSFAGIASGWFAWVLQPVRQLRRPRGIFPAGASLIESVPDFVLARVLGPLGTIIQQVAGVARRLQHGRLQYYVLYIVAGLVAVAALVLYGGPS